MAKIAAACMVGAEISDALGLKHVVNLDISLHIHDIARITVTYYPDEEHLKNAIKVLKKYKIVPLEE